MNISICKKSIMSSGGSLLPVNTYSSPDPIPLS
jgi:hypothetical protein